MRGWLLGLAIAAGCAGRAQPRAPRTAGLAPSRAVPMVTAPTMTASVAPPVLAPAAVPMTAPRAGVAALPLGDRALVRALNRAQPSFLRCFRRAQRLDPGLVRATVTVLGRVSPAGQLEDATADAPTPALGACVVAVARAMRFDRAPAPTSIVVPLRFAAP